MEHNISISCHSNLGPQFKMLKCTIWNENSDSQVTNIMASSKLNIRNLEAPTKLEKISTNNYNHHDKIPIKLC